MHKRTYVMLLIDDRDVRVLRAEDTGELLATFRIDPQRTYQPRLHALWCPRCPETGVRDVPRHHKSGEGGI